MIRDPSDGSVREKPVDEKASLEAAMDDKAKRIKDLMSSTTSGLAPLDKDQNDAARLKRSREQLENYKRTGVWK